MRETGFSRDTMHSILHQLINDFQNDWLLTLEICELSKDRCRDIYKIAYNHLMDIIKSNPGYEKLILDGLKII